MTFRIRAITLIIMWISLVVFSPAFLGAGNLIPSQSANSREENVRTLLRMTIGADLTDQVSAQELDAFKKAYPAIPQELWSELGKSAKADAIIEIYVPIYMKYFSDEEIRWMIALYQSPFGQKLLQVTPMLAKDVSVALMTRGLDAARAASGNAKPVQPPRDCKQNQC